ncbi:MAG: phosphatidylglycerophosphatase A family protein [Acetobacteraceae bacterium]
MLASGFGAGHVPVAPGTAGSIAAVLTGAGLMRLGPTALPLAVLGASFGGLWAVASSQEAHDDPGWVVIDEIAGQWITLLGLARPTPAGLLAAFAVFRLLDIVKPGPVGWADRQHGAAGVMAGDLIAGALGAGILLAARTRFPHLFG